MLRFSILLLIERTMLIATVIPFAAKIEFGVDLFDQALIFFALLTFIRFFRQILIMPYIAITSVMFTGAAFAVISLIFNQAVDVRVWCMAGLWVLACRYEGAILQEARNR